ncbi:E4 [Gammapapillomavirus 22]|uniref:E4 n=1 Tax=Gammapapillomavirus 22 TaxID=1961679 RepID=A0A2D2AM09_9PAPI|nr:E4 [Gammapapillomavirus 22]
MDCILKMNMEIKVIFYYLLMRLKNMVPVEDGLLNINMKLFLLLPLSALHKGRSPNLLKDLSKDLSVPPGTPYPHRKLQEDRNKKREDLVPPHRRHLHIDEDDEEANKENTPQYPLGPKDDERRRAYLGYLLEKWAEDIIWYQEQVFQDLRDLKQKLGIPQ